MTYTIETGDARATMFENGRFRCIVTSPPYWGLRSYTGQENEIGTGPAAQYIADMKLCALEWHRIASDDCTLWLNLGDTAAGSGGAGGDYNSGGAKDGKPRWKQGEPGRPKMQWMNMPHRVVEEFVSAGWLYRSCVTWEKPGRRPEDLNHVRRPGVSHEFIFMLTKSRKYVWNNDALKETGSVWHFPTSRGRNHLAPFPLELPLRCIALSSEPGDQVLDPFAGSGTTLEAAEQLGRIGIGLDIEDWLNS